MDLLTFPRTIEEGEDVEVDESESNSEDEVCLRVHDRLSVIDMAP